MIQLLKFSPLLLIAVGAAVLVVVWAPPGPWTAGADGTGPRMALSASGEGVLCDAASEPAACAVPLAGRFALAVEVMGAPAEGYVAFQSQVFYDSLAYQPRDVADEIVWPESALPVRFPAAPTGGEGLVSHGDVSSTSPPFPASSHAGSVIELDLVCSAKPRSFTLALLPYDAAARPLGAGFGPSLEGPGGGVGSTVPAKTVGTAPLDLDGDTTAEALAIAGQLAIGCGGAVSTPSDTPSPTGTPTPTATPAATATPTRTPTPPNGDVNKDGRTNSIDATLVLQFVAGLLPSANRNADVNEDGRTNSIDATLILQLVAGLIDRLPPR